MDYRAINKKLVSSQIEDQLIRFIADNYQTGDRLPNEFSLAKRFSTSRSTIREVVKGLVSQGMLSVRQGSGTFVLSVYPLKADPLCLGNNKDKYQLALELLDVRLMLEPEIAAGAAVNADEDDIKCLYRLCKVVEANITADRDHTSEDRDFHAWIAKCNGNSVVETLVPLIQTGVSTFVNVTQSVLKEETIRTHRMITEAIKQHDAIAAKYGMISHLLANRDVILKLMLERDMLSKNV